MQDVETYDAYAKVEVRISSVNRSGKLTREKIQTCL